MVGNSVHWFRKGSRSHDNPASQEASSDADSVRCVYISDPWFAGAANVGINRWRFSSESSEDSDNSSKKLNSRSFVVRGQPTEVFPRLFKEWNVTRSTFEYDPEPYGKERDGAIIKMAQEFGVETIVRKSHTLYNSDRIIEMNNNNPPSTFKRFQTIVSRSELPRRPSAPISQQQTNGCLGKISDNHDQSYGIPSLEELGFRTEGLPPAVWRGGESEALDRSSRYSDKNVWVANTRAKTCSSYASPTGLSPYSRFGCSSCRMLYYNSREIYMKLCKRSSPPSSSYGQLSWREFFYTAATNNPNFDRMEGNPICVQIPWDQNPEASAKWAEGRTGFPWIDAIMTQSRQEGWIHHRARHAVACFLTRSDSWISWESGMKVFEESSSDADWSVNAGSWMWSSCSAFFQQFFHCYCPVGFGRRTDPSGDYIRRYIPISKDYPNRYIHEPWNAPSSSQKAVNCVVGVDYPKPMINHAEGSRLNIERMKQVYQQSSHYRGLSSSASVPTIQEEAEPPMTDESQTSSGPDSPPRVLAEVEASDWSMAPDSSTSVPHSDQEDSPHSRPFQDPCTSSGRPSSPTSSPAPRSDPGSPSSACSPSSFPLSISGGPRTKGGRRSQRQRERKSSPMVMEEAERMQEEVEADEERMEEETAAVTSGGQ